MKAITLYQPYASLIADGFKTIETRTHDRLRGLAGKRIAIHAAARAPSNPYLDQCWREAAVHGVDEEALEWLSHHPGGDVEFAPLAVILCTAQVATFGLLNDEEHGRAACCHIDRNRFGLFLEDVRTLEEPVPYKGNRGIWNVPDDVIPDYAR